jgi:hypothetical protein
VCAEWYNAPVSDLEKLLIYGLMPATIIALIVVVALSL